MLLPSRSFSSTSAAAIILLLAVLVCVITIALMQPSWAVCAATSADSFNFSTASVWNSEVILNISAVPTIDFVPMWGGSFNDSADCVWRSDDAFNNTAPMWGGSLTYLTDCGGRSDGTFNSTIHVWAMVDVYSDFVPEPGGSFSEYIWRSDSALNNTIHVWAMVDLVSDFVPEPGGSFAYFFTNCVARSEDTLNDKSSLFGHFENCAFDVSKCGVNSGLAAIANNFSSEVAIWQIPQSCFLFVLSSVSITKRRRGQVQFLIVFALLPTVLAMDGKESGLGLGFAAATAGAALGQNASLLIGLAAGR